MAQELDPITSLPREDGNKSSIDKDLAAMVGSSPIQTRAPSHTASGTGSLGSSADKFTDYIPEGRGATNLQDLQSQRARNQPGWEQAGRTLITLPADIALGIVENAGYLLDLQAHAQTVGNILGISDGNDYSNFFTDFAKRSKEAIDDNFAVYRENPNEVFDLGDPAWWFEHGGGLVESIAEFLVTGMGVGKALGSAAKGIANLMGKAAGVRTVSGLGMGTQIGTSAALAYTEGAMSGADVYKDIYQKGIEQGLPEEEAIKKASQAAAKTVQINTVANTMLNFTSVRPMFRAGRQMKELAKKGLAKKSTESRLQYLKRLKDSKEFIPLKNQMIKTLGIEATQESLEEVVNRIAEEEGKFSGRKDLGILSSDEKDLSWLERTMRTINTEETALAAILGAFGGIGQTAGMELTPTKQKIRDEDGKVTEVWKSANQMKKEAEKNLYDKQIKFLTQRLEDIGSAQEKIGKAKTEKEYDEAVRELDATTDLHNIVNGTEEQLIAAIEEIEQMKPEEAENAGFLEDFKERARKRVETIKHLSKKWYEIEAKYGFQDDEKFASLPETIFRTYIDRYYTERDIKSATIAEAELKADLDAHLKRMFGKDVDSETVIGITEAIEHQDTVKAFKGAVEKRIAELAELENMSKKQIARKYGSPGRGKKTETHAKEVIQKEIEELGKKAMAASEVLKATEDKYFLKDKRRKRYKPYHEMLAKTRDYREAVSNTGEAIEFMKSRLTDYNNMMNNLESAEGRRDVVKAWKEFNDKIKKENIENEKTEAASDTASGAKEDSNIKKTKKSKSADHKAKDAKAEDVEYEDVETTEKEEEGKEDPFWRGTDEEAEEAKKAASETTGETSEDLKEEFKDYLKNTEGNLSPRDSEEDNGKDKESKIESLNKRINNIFNILKMLKRDGIISDFLSEDGFYKALDWFKDELGDHPKGRDIINDFLIIYETIAKTAKENELAGIINAKREGADAYDSLSKKPEGDGYVDNHTDSRYDDTKDDADGNTISYEGDKIVEAAVAFAYKSKEFEYEKEEDQTSKEIIIRKRTASNEKDPDLHKELESHFDFQEGDKITLVVDKTHDDYAQYVVDGKVTDPYMVPIAIKKNGETVAYIHTEAWLRAGAWKKVDGEWVSTENNHENVADDETGAGKDNPKIQLDNLLEIRKAIVSKGDKGVETTITYKGVGRPQPHFNEEGDKVNGNTSELMPDTDGILITKNNTFYENNDKESDNLVNAEKERADGRIFVKVKTPSSEKFMALPIYMKNLSEQHVESMMQIIKAYVSHDTETLTNIKNAIGINIVDQKTLNEVLSRFTYIKDESEENFKSLVFDGDIPGLVKDGSKKKERVVRHINIGVKRNQRVIELATQAKKIIRIDDETSFSGEVEAEIRAILSDMLTTVKMSKINKKDEKYVLPIVSINKEGEVEVSSESHSNHNDFVKENSESPFRQSQINEKEWTSFDNPIILFSDKFISDSDKSTKEELELIEKVAKEIHTGKKEVDDDEKANALLVFSEEIEEVVARLQREDDEKREESPEQPTSEVEETKRVKEIVNKLPWKIEKRDSSLYNNVTDLIKDGYSLDDITTAVGTIASEEGYEQYKEMLEENVTQLDRLQKAAKSTEQTQQTSEVDFTFNTEQEAADFVEANNVVSGTIIYIKEEGYDGKFKVRNEEEIEFTPIQTSEVEAKIADIERRIAELNAETKAASRMAPGKQTTPAALKRSKKRRDELVILRKELAALKSTQPAGRVVNIFAGTGENAELSNFAKRPFTNRHGFTYNTVEGAFQAAKIAYTEVPGKYHDGNTETDAWHEMEEKLGKATGKEAKRLGRTIKGLNTAEWNKNSSLEMKELIKRSFAQNPDALQELLATGNATLTHTQDKSKWGKEFPRILMEVREELRTKEISDPRDDDADYAELAEQQRLADIEAMEARETQSKKPATKIDFSADKDGTETIEYSKYEEKSRVTETISRGFEEGDEVDVDEVKKGHYFKVISAPDEDILHESKVIKILEESLIRDGVSAKEAKKKAKRDVNSLKQEALNQLLKFGEEITPTITPETEEGDAFEEEDNETNLSSRTSDTNFSISESELEEMREEASDYLVTYKDSNGKTVSFDSYKQREAENSIISFIVRRIYKQKKGEEKNAREIFDEVKKSFKSASINMENYSKPEAKLSLKELARIPGSSKLTIKEAKEIAKALAEEFNLIVDNWEQFEKFTIERLSVYGIKIESRKLSESVDKAVESQVSENEDAISDQESHLEKKSFDDNANFTIDHKDSASSRMKTFLSTIVDAEYVPFDNETRIEFPQNKISGRRAQGSTQYATDKVKEQLGENPHSIDMIAAGLRTRTTKPSTSIEQYEKLKGSPLAVGDMITHVGKSADGSKKKIRARITAIHKKGTEKFDSSWHKEGWTEKGKIEIDKFKGDAVAIEFEVVDEGNRKLIPKKNYLGLNSLIPFDTAFENLQVILADTDSTMDAMMSKMKDVSKSSPWIKSVIKKLESQPIKIKKEFVTLMSKQYTEFDIILWNKIKTKKKGKETYKYVLRPISANRNSITNVISENWKENMKNSRIIKEVNGELVIDKKVAEELKNELIRINDDYKNKEIPNSVVIKMLNDIGIEMSEDALNYFKKISKKATGIDYRAHFSLKRNTAGIFTNIIAKLVKDDSNLIGKVEKKFELNNPFVDEERGIKILASVVAKFTPSLHSHSHKSSEGKDIFSYVLNSNLSHTFRKISERKSAYRDLLGKLSFSNSNNSSWINMLNTNDKFLQVFKLSYMSGLKKTSRGARGIERKGMSERELELMSIAMFQNEARGRKSPVSKFIYPTISDKTTTPVITALKHVIDESGATGFEINEDGTFNLSDKTLKELFKIARAEMSRIHNFQNKESGVKENVDKNGLDKYKDGAELFYMFPFLNKDQLEDPSILWNGDSIKIDSKVNYEAVKGLIQNYVNSLVQDTLTNWERMGITDGNSHMMDESYFGTTSGRNTKEKLIYAAIDIEVNYLIANANIYQMFSGDPAIHFKKPSNKIKNPTSQDFVEATMVEVQKRLAKDIAPGMDADWSGNKTYTVVHVKDKKIKTILDEYSELAFGSEYKRGDATDAQEFTTVEEHIDVMYHYGKIEEKIYKSIKKKIEKAVKDKKNVDNYYTLEEEEKEAILQPMKPVYSNSHPSREMDVNRIVYIKSSSFPLLPEMTRELEIDNLRIAMENAKVPIRRLVHNTAAKLGAVNIVEIYNEDGTIKDNIDFSKPDILNRTGMRIQQEIPYDPTKTKILTVSQMNKLLFEGILGVEGFNYKGKKWKGEDLRAEKERLRSEMVEIEKETLFNKLGIKIEGNEIIFTDLEKIKKIIIEEAKTRKGYSVNDFKNLALTPDGKQFEIPLGFNSKTKKIEPLLLSIITNTILRQKINGKSWIQGTNVSMMTKRAQKAKPRSLESIEEDKRSEMIFVEGFQNEKGLEYLRKSDDGKSSKPIQIMVPFLYKGKDGKPLKLKDYIKTLKNGQKVIDKEKLPDELRRLIGARIPNQGHNSMAPIEIVGFLPPNMGDLIIVPEEMVVQMGSDFDVDKLYTYIYNYDVAEDGKLSKTTKDLKEKSVDTGMYHFTTEESAKSLTKEKYKFGLPPVFGTGANDMKAGSEGKPMVKDVVYVTEDKERWKERGIITKEGEGTEDVTWFDYDKQEWNTTKKGKRKEKLVKLNVEINPKANILVIDSLEEYEKFKLSREEEKIYEGDSMFVKTINKARAKGYDGVKIKYVEGKWWKEGEKRFRAFSQGSGLSDIFMFDPEMVTFSRGEETLKENNKIKALQKRLY